MSAKLLVISGGLAMLSAVILGAFGVHALKKTLSPEMLTVFQTGVQYHFYHALGLLILGLLAYHLPDASLLRSAGWFMLIGIVLFSGSLYILATSGVRWLGAITPIGGTMFILAWLLMVIGVCRS